MLRQLRRWRIAIAFGALGTVLAVILFAGRGATSSSASPDDAQVRGSIVRAAHLLQEQSGMQPRRIPITVQGRSPGAGHSSQRSEPGSHEPVAPPGSTPMIDPQ